MATIVDATTISSDNEKCKPSRLYSISRERPTKHHLSAFAKSHHIHPTTNDQSVGRASHAHPPINHHHVPHGHRVQSAHAKFGRKDMSYRKHAPFEHLAYKKFDDITGGRLRSPPPESRAPALAAAWDDSIHKKNYSSGLFTYDIARNQNEPSVKNGAEFKAASAPKPNAHESSSSRSTRDRIKATSSMSNMSGNRNGKRPFLLGTHSPWTPQTWQSHLGIMPGLGSPRVARKGLTPNHVSVHSSPSDASGVSMLQQDKNILSPVEANEFKVAGDVSIERPRNGLSKAARKQAPPTDVRPTHTAPHVTPVQLHRETAPTTNRTQETNDINTPLTHEKSVDDSTTASAGRVNNNPTIHPSRLQEEFVVMETPSPIINSKPGSSRHTTRAVHVSEKPANSDETVQGPSAKPVLKPLPTQKDVASKVPLSLEEFEKVFQRYLVNLHAAHEYHVKVSSLLKML